MDGVYVAEEKLMHRFYADPERGTSSEAYLTPEDAHHALRVLRLSEASPVEVFAGGRRYAARISSVRDGDVCVCLENELSTTETAVRMTLLQGLPKGDKMDLIVQKAVELGVSDIRPVIMTRCVMRLDPRDAAKKRERWQKIAREAGKQSGRCIVPEVFLPVRLNSLAEIRGQMDELIVPWELSSGYGPLSFVRDHPSIRSLGILIGPEGGISAEEMDFLTSILCTPVTLGPRILRTETAGLAAVSALSVLYGEME